MHCLDRMKERHLPLDQVRAAIVEGKKNREKENEYKIKWQGWILEVSKQECYFYVNTAYHE